MAYNPNLPLDNTADIRENFRALKEDKIVAADTANTADKLSIARTISLTGDAIGSALFDGSADIAISVDVTNADNADTVGGKTVEQLISAAMPVGSIILWSGNTSTIPTNWKLCNGTNGTPDLRNRFVIGAGNSYGVGATGGEANHTLSVAEIPSHSHASGGESNYNVMKNGNGELGYTHYQESWETVPMNSLSSSNTGGSQAHNNMPPYYALAYIQKIA